MPPQIIWERVNEDSFLLHIKEIQGQSFVLVNLAQHLRKIYKNEIIEAVASEQNILLTISLHVVFDKTFQDRVTADIKAKISQPVIESIIEIKLPIYYGEEYALDIQDIAQSCSCSVDDVIALHSQQCYRVSLMGFSLGFAYLTNLPKQLRLPRRSTPRTKISTGSLAIAEHYTAIYPSASPGGWHIIGHCPISLLSGNEEDPCLLKTRHAGPIYAYF